MFYFWKFIEPVTWEGDNSSIKLNFISTPDLANLKLHLRESALSFSLVKLKRDEARRKTSDSSTKLQGERKTKARRGSRGVIIGGRVVPILEGSSMPTRVCLAKKFGYYTRFSLVFREFTRRKGRDAKKKKKKGEEATLVCCCWNRLILGRGVIGLDASHHLNVTFPSARIPPRRALPNIGHWPSSEIMTQFRSLVPPWIIQLVLHWSPIDHFITAQKNSPESRDNPRSLGSRRDKRSFRQCVKFASS